MSSTGAPHPAPPTAAAAPAAHAPAGPRTTGSYPGHESSTALSPGTVSPSVLSREGSVQGPLAALAATTPTAVKQKIKQQVRHHLASPHLAHAPGQRTAFAEEETPTGPPRTSKRWPWRLIRTTALARAPHAAGPVPDLRARQ